MANRHQKDVYCFIQDFNGLFYRASQLSDGTYIITKNAQPMPLKFNPSNLIKAQLEFGTNQRYNSLNRSISYTFDFIKDGFAIIRQGYIMSKGIEEKMYFTVIQWNGIRNLYELSYQGKIDFSQKVDDPANETFSVSTIDDSAWGVLSQNDETQYSIECNASNPNCIKVLFDGLTLKNKYTFQTVNAPTLDNTPNSRKTLPLVLINQDGDSAGVIVKNQTDADYATITDLELSPSWFFYTAYPITDMQIVGEFTFIADTDYDFPNLGIQLWVTSNLGQIQTILDLPPGTPIAAGQRFSVSFDFGMDLSAGEALFFAIALNGGAIQPRQITPITTNISIYTITRPQAIVAYGLRPLDLLQELVNKATNNRFTINSSFFVENNKDIALSGDSLRGIPNAKIYSSFADFFDTFNAIYYMALRVINGALWMEKYIEVYRQDTTIFDIGDCVSFKSVPAIEYYFNELEAGSPKQDYRHPSGRLEFNSVNTWSFPILTVNKKQSYITKYRLGCYDITFLILDYQGQSTQDNTGDKSVYLAKITDELGMAVDDLETFENINVDNVPLEPIIKSPLNNDILTYDLPVIKGIAPPGSTVNIYVDTVLDGTTVADVNGNWSYNIVTPLSPFVIGVTTGIHVIDATYTDETAPVSTITITVDTSIITPTIVTYPQANDNLFNNIPLIKGVAQQGAVFDVFLDGVNIGTVTGDESCKWELQSPVITNGAHTILADGRFTSFNVDNNIEFPLITYIGSQLDGFLIINNLPLIKGIAKPFTSVDLWLNYISFSKLNITPIIADANGDWSYEVVPVNYIDPVTGLSIVLAPIRNGLSVISTSLVNHVVGIVVTGFKLSRPAYSSITGVIDNTVFNTEYSPKRMIGNHYPEFASMRLNGQITFQTADKNGNLRTVLDGVVVAENANIPVSQLGTPIQLLEYGQLKTKATKTFADLLYNFNQGGVIKTNFRGTDLYFLPKGSMKINNLTSEVQEWKLLMSPLTTLFSLLNLYKQGTTIQLNNNTMYHSDYNSLHAVEYDFTPDPNINTKDLYDDWFNNRNDFWALNPDYIQKYNHNESFRDQVITRTSSNMTLRFFRCKDAIMVKSFPYLPVAPAPINPPEIIMEAQINLNEFPNGQYFAVLFVDETAVSIFERIETRDNWPRTIRIESYNSKNLVGAYFSNGFRTILRVEGIVKKWQPHLVDFEATLENGDTEMLYAVSSRKRIIRYGTARGLPDYLYLKCSLALSLDNMQTEGVYYTLDPEEKINPSDDIAGHPLYYYNINVFPKENTLGKVFEVADETSHAVFLNVDGTAIGLEPGTIISIELDNE